MARPVTADRLQQLRDVLRGDEQWVLTHRIGRLESPEFFEATGCRSEVVFHETEGFVLLKHNPQGPETEIYFVYVRPECRRRGVLRRMLSRALGGAKGVVRLDVSRCSADGGRALVRMWEKMGFTEDERQPAPEFEITCMHRVA